MDTAIIVMVTSAAAQISTVAPESGQGKSLLTRKMIWATYR